MKTTTTQTIETTAYCQECEWETKNIKNIEQLSRKHRRDTNHEVHYTKTTLYKLKKQIK